MATIEGLKKNRIGSNCFYKIASVYIAWIWLRASLKTLIDSLRKSGLAAYTRNPLVNPLTKGSVIANSNFKKLPFRPA